MKRTALYIGLCVVLASPGAAQTPLGTTTTIENDRTAAEGELSTREGRLQVEPLDWDETRGAGLRTEAIQEPELAEPTEETIGATGGGMPRPEADAEAEQAFPDQWEGLRSRRSLENLDESRGPGIRGTKDVFTQYCENCGGVNLSYPMKAIGKLFTDKGSCSASVVSGNDIIVTAAHCCYDRSAGNWIGGWEFAPAYRDGYAPYGTFGWSTATILTRWINVGDRKSDVCAIRLRDNSRNRPVTYYTGWLGRSWNWGTTQSMHWLGYPGNIGGGNKQELCVSETFNPSSGCGGASVLNAGCSMTYGASGGPGIRSYRGSNWVNSVVSGYDGSSCTGSFGQTFNGPRFTSDNIVKVCDSIGC